MYLLLLHTYVRMTCDFTEMPGSLDPQYHREPGSKWPGFLVNRSGLPIDDQTWSQVSLTHIVYHIR